MTATALGGVLVPGLVALDATSAAAVVVTDGTSTKLRKRTSPTYTGASAVHR